MDWKALICRSMLGVRTRRAGAGLVTWALLLNLARGSAGVTPYHIDAWEVENGLPQSSITSIVQTRDGYLWLGTFNGLVRFDGVQFKVFSPNSVPGLPSSRIVQLFEDRAGTLWIGTEEGAVVRFTAGRFESFALPAALKSPGYAHTFAETSDHMIWIATSERRLLRFAADRFTSTSAQWNLEGTGIGSLITDSRGQLWVTTEREVAVWQGDRFEPLSRQPSQQNPDYGLVAASAQGGCWVGQQDHLQRWNAGRCVENYPSHQWAKGDLYCMLEDRDGQVWLGTYGSGLFCYSTNGSVLHVGTDEGLPGNLIRSLCQDSEGDLWVGTEGNGLARLKPTLFREYTRQQGLSGDCVLALCEGHEGELWIGTNGDGIDRLQKGELRHYGSAEGLANEYVWSVIEDRDHQVWAGTWGGGLFRLAGDKFVPVSGRGRVGSVVCALFQDSIGSLWVGQQSASPEILQLRTDEPSIVRLEQPPSNTDVRALAEDAAGNLWIGTHGGGLYRISQGRQTHFGRTNGLSSDFIRSLYADQEGVLWVGTYGGGLDRVQAGRITSFTTRQGLLSDSLCYITEDARSNLWCGSLGGVFRVNKQELNQYAEHPRGMIRCLSYTTVDGLPSLECSGGSQPSGCKTHDGLLWFPTVRGLAVVDPEHVPFNPLPPPVVIEEVIAEGKAGSNVFALVGSPPPANVHAGGPPEEPASLKIAPGNQRLEFRYTGLSFVAPKKVQFKYRLEGLENEWVEARTGRTANYGYLPPGNYRFSVRACNNDGVWSEPGASVNLTILPHFWQTWAFRVVVGLVALLLLAGIYELRLASERKLARLRLRIARDLHDEVGSNLGSIALLSEVMPPMTGGVDEIAEIRRIALQTIASLRDIVWFLDSSSDRMDDLVLRMKDIAKAMLPGVRFDFESLGETNAPPPSLELRRNIFPMFKEILHNIVKHASATDVDIRLSISSRQFSLRVRDNGIGFEERANGTGNGLKNLRRRAAELSGVLEIQSRPGAGTLVTLHAPIP
jgi:ligand-binding sensor domain-containing protein/signal transduction histidine kinase